MSMAIKKENENFIAKRSCFMHNYLCYQRLVPYSIATETYHLIETHHLLFFGESAKEPDDFDEPIRLNSLCEVVKLFEFLIASFSSAPVR